MTIALILVSILALLLFFIVLLLTVPVVSLVAINFLILVVSMSQFRKGKKL